MTAHTGSIGNKKDLIGTSGTAWTLSASGTNEYYYNIDDLADESDTVYENSVEMIVETILVEDCEDAWNELVDADVTSTLETTIIQVGAGSAKLAVGDLVAAGDILATEAIAPIDISGADSIRFWIRSSVVTAAGDLQLLLDETASCASPSETLSIPALVANTWTEVTVALTALAADLDAIISVGIKCVVDIGAHDLYIDDIQAVVPAPVAGSLVAGQSVIGDNDSIGHNTVYVRLTDSADPDTKAAAFVEINEYAHNLLLAYIKTALEAESWVTQRYVCQGDNHELIIKGEGYGGLETIYIGFYTYQSVASDYYNMAVATMKGYTAGNNFINQPGIQYSGVPCHNQAIDYWMSINAARINGCLKVGTPVYEHFGAGNFIPFAPPSQYPQPLFNAGMLTGMAATRFSNTTQSMPWKAVLNSYNFAIHTNQGEWEDSFNVDTDKEIKTLRVLESLIRPAESTYAVQPIYIYDTTPNIYGELDGIYLITGFDNVVENTIVINAENYVVLQDVYRTGFGDYIAMKLV